MASDVQSRRLRVHFAYEPSAEVVVLLKEALSPGIELTFGDAATGSGEIEVLVAGVPTREFLDAHSSLQTLVIPFAGLPRPTRELLVDFPRIAVYNLHHNAVATAETALALLFAAAKNVIPIDRRLRANDWTSRHDGGGEQVLSGRTAVILGFGAIGRTLAGMTVALGMNVIGVRRSLSGPTSAEGHESNPPIPGLELCAVDSLHSVLPRAAVLFVTVPLTVETEGLLGSRELELLPDDAILINVARGLVVDEQALFAELSKGRIRAGIDVWYSYPKGDDAILSTPPSAFPFHQLDNVVMSPHRAGHYEGIERVRTAALIKLLRACHARQSMPNRVDLSRGY